MPRVPGTKSSATPRTQTAATSPEIDAYIEAAAEPARSRLAELRAVIREEAPEAVERMAYGLPTWHLGENLVHLGAFAKHVGVYPGPAAIEEHAAELAAYKTSKGAIQLPHALALPLELVRRIVRARVAKLRAASR